MLNKILINLSRVKNSLGMYSKLGVFVIPNGNVGSDGSTDVVRDAMAMKIVNGLCELDDSVHIKDVQECDKVVTAVDNIKGVALVVNIDEDAVSNKRRIFSANEDRIRAIDGLKDDMI